jgi:hypothetical protein
VPSLAQATIFVPSVEQAMAAQPRLPAAVCCVQFAPVSVLTIMNVLLHAAII